MAHIDRSETLGKLKGMQQNIQFESDEDEYAAFFFAEIESLIHYVKDPGLDDDTILYMADKIGLRRNLVYEFRT